MLTAALALAAGLFFSHACAQAAKSSSGGDAGHSDDAGPGSDAGGTTTTVVPDAGCASDSVCGSNRWCEQSTGACRDAKPCPQGQGNCDYQFAEPDYCAGQRCYCDPADQGCKPLHTPCSACARSAECGDDKLAYDVASDCVPPSAGFADASVCIPRKDSYLGCPQGWQTPASGTYCIPGGGHCGAQGSCHSDADCDPHSKSPICNTQLGLCAAGCTFDLKTGASPECPAGQVCHLTPALAALPPQDPNYGMGKCGPPCTGEAFRKIELEHGEELRLSLGLDLGQSLAQRRDCSFLVGHPVQNDRTDTEKTCRHRA